MTTNSRFDVCEHAPYCCISHRLRPYWCRVCNTRAMFPELHPAPSCPIVIHNTVQYPQYPQYPHLPQTTMILPQQVYTGCQVPQVQQCPEPVARVNCPNSCPATTCSIKK